MKHLHKHKRYFTVIAIAFLLIQSLSAQFDVVVRDPLLPWDQIRAQKIKSIRVMECGDGKNDTLNQGFMYYEFNSLGHLILSSDYGESGVRMSSWITYQYNSAGQLVTENHHVIRPTGAEEIPYFLHYSYNEKGWMKSCVHQVNMSAGKQAPLDSFAYSYDAAGHLLKRVYYSRTIYPPGPWEYGFENDFGYDSLGRKSWTFLKNNNTPAPDTTFFTYDAQGQLASEFEKFDWLPEEYYGQEDVMVPDGDTTLKPATKETFPRLKGILRTTYDWSTNACSLTQRSEGIDPLDVNYSFTFTRMEFDERGKIVLKSRKYKSMGINWVRYFYTYYP
jgi:hypothetical protein